MTAAATQYRSRDFPHSDNRINSPRSPRFAPARTAGGPNSLLPVAALVTCTSQRKEGSCGRFTRVLLAAALATFFTRDAACSAADLARKTAESPAPALIPVPTPAPASRSRLPEALKKTVPVSISDLRSIQQHVEALVPKVSPAVVAVEVGGASGSGVVISADGLVLTAGHVAGSAGRQVRFVFPDGKVATGRTVGADPETDTGLMRITNSGPWPHVSVGDLQGVRLGDWVLALGHPGGFDLQRSLVVRLGRIISLVPGVLQTDCTISPGDSGGPLFDMNGRIIAIHTAISPSVAENFHVPITEFFDSWKELVASNTSRKPRAYLGVTITDDPPGCRIAALEHDGPAAKAGMKIGDHVIQVDGRDILASASLRRWLAETDPGETLNLQIKRGDKTFPLTVKLAPPPRE